MDERRTLVLLAQAGDADAFATLVAARRSALLVLLAATVGDWDEAEDALQDALWRAFTGLRTLRDPHGFDVWLRRVALNVARDHLRARLARWRREGEPAGDGADLDRLCAALDAAADPSVDPDAGDCGDILRAIASLPPLARRAGRLAWVAGVRGPQVADLLGVSADSVHAALHRGRARLGEMFYAKGDWRKDVALVPDGAVRVASYPEPILTHLRQTRPDLPTATVEPHQDADLRLRLFWGESPARGAEPPPPAEALPLDRLADAAGLDLEPFGHRLRRFTVAGRPYWLPHHDVPHLYLYNADLLEQAGLPPPRWDWTWHEFFGYCRRCAAAGLHPVNMFSPNAWDVGLVAEELGATREKLDPLRDAVAFVQDWRRQGWTAPEEVPDWAVGQFLAGRCVFCIMQAGHPAHWFDRFRPFRWGVAPVPRFRRDDPPIRYWFHFAAHVPGTAADPTAAFAAAAAALTDGPIPPNDDLPAYRTPERMRAWLAQPTPLGKECLLELEAATDPLFEPRHFLLLPGVGEALQGMLDGTLDIDEGLGRARAGVERHRAGERVPLR